MTPEVNRLLATLPLRAKRRLHRRQWRIHSIVWPHWGENRYFPACLRRTWFSPRLRWREVDHPRGFGWLSFATNEAAVEFCRALDALHVIPSDAPKQSFAPVNWSRERLGVGKSSDVAFGEGVVAGVVLGGLL
jgi:hypothetical protein